MNRRKEILAMKGRRKKKLIHDGPLKPSSCLTVTLTRENARLDSVGFSDSKLRDALTTKTSDQ